MFFGVWGGRGGDDTTRDTGWGGTRHTGLRRRTIFTPPFPTCKEPRRYPRPPPACRRPTWAPPPHPPAAGGSAGAPRPKAEKSFPGRLRGPARLSGPGRGKPYRSLSFGGRGRGEGGPPGRRGPGPARSAVRGAPGGWGGQTHCAGNKRKILTANAAGEGLPEVGQELVNLCKGLGIPRVVVEHQAAR